MNYWFTTSHGETCHNDPSSPNYVLGEPPEFPENRINYRLKCLQEGFARLGFPNTGDLLDPGKGRLAPNGYSLDTIDTISPSPLTRRQLLEFASIQAGDIILIPADENQFDVHIGKVLTRDRKEIPAYIHPRTDAYYFHHDIPNGDFYECAHRVNVKWARDQEGEYGVFTVTDLGGIWRLAFSQVFTAIDQIKFLLRQALL